MHYYFQKIAEPLCANKKKSHIYFVDTTNTEYLYKFVPYVYILVIRYFVHI